MTSIVRLLFLALTLAVFVESMGVFFPIGHRHQEGCGHRDHSSSGGSSEESSSEEMTTTEEVQSTTTIESNTAPTTEKSTTNATTATPKSTTESSPTPTSTTTAATTTNPTTSTTAESTTSDIRYCPEDTQYTKWMLFQRTPTAANNWTEWICLTPAVGVVLYDYGSITQSCLYIPGESLATFENIDEENAVLEAARNLVPTLTNFSLAVNAFRNESCRTVETLDDCGNYTFWGTGITDLAFTTSHWAPGQPETIYYPNGNVSDPEVYDSVAVIAAGPNAGLFTTASYYDSGPIFNGAVCSIAPIATPQ